MFAVFEDSTRFTYLARTRFGTSHHHSSMCAVSNRCSEVRAVSEESCQSVTKSAQQQVLKWNFGLRKIILFVFVFTHLATARAFKFPFNFRHSHKSALKVLYQYGNSEEDLLECAPWAVCNRVDTYSAPWVERQCRCPGNSVCSMSRDSNDGHTIADKTKQYKLCEPVSRLPICRYFRDITWTIISQPDNTSQQIIHCVCPKKSVAYIVKHDAYQAEDGTGYLYHFACSPESKLRCRRKEPCRLFTVRKRPEVEEVNTYVLCQCPHGHTCPQHHTEPSVIADTVYPQDHLRTFSGYCSSELQ